MSISEDANIGTPYQKSASLVFPVEIVGISMVIRSRLHSYKRIQICTTFSGSNSNLTGVHIFSTKKSRNSQKANKVLTIMDLATDCEIDVLGQTRGNGGMGAESDLAYCYTSLKYACSRMEWTFVGFEH